MNIKAWCLAGAFLVSSGMASSYYGDDEASQNAKNIDLAKTQLGNRYYQQNKIQNRINKTMCNEKGNNPFKYSTINQSPYSENIIQNKQKRWEDRNTINFPFRGVFPMQEVSQNPINIPTDNAKQNMDTGSNLPFHKKKSLKKTCIQQPSSAFTQSPEPNPSSGQVPRTQFNQVPSGPFWVIYPGLPFPVMYYPGLPFPVMYLPGMPGPVMLVPFIPFPDTIAHSRAPIQPFQNSDNSN